MMTPDELHRHIGRTPFQPFRLTLTSGETLEVNSRFRAVAMKGELVVATQADRLRWIQLGSIARVEPFQLPPQPSH
jgi:hypothetical protein